MKRVILFLMIMSFCASRCARKCNEFTIYLEELNGVKIHSPILVEDGIVGYVENLDKRDSGFVVSVCIPVGLTMSGDTKVYNGYVNRYGVPAIVFIPGGSSSFLKHGDLIESSVKDSIRFNVPNSESDSLLIDSAKTMFRNIIIERGKKMRDTVSHQK
jgi:hypothetical protein